MSFSLSSGSSPPLFHLHSTLPQWSAACWQWPGSDSRCTTSSSPTWLVRLCLCCVVVTMCLLCSFSATRDFQASCYCRSIHRSMRAFRGAPSCCLNLWHICWFTDVSQVNLCQLQRSETCLEVRTKVESKFLHDHLCFMSSQTCSSSCFLLFKKKSFFCILFFVRNCVVQTVPKADTPYWWRSPLLQWASCFCCPGWTSTASSASTRAWRRGRSTSCWSRRRRRTNRHDERRWNEALPRTTRGSVCK